MPIYEFECMRCGNRFERLQKLADPDPSSCPECGQASVRRRLNAPAFRLAGSGWYETDFKKEGDKKRNLADKGDGKATAPSAANSNDKPSDTTSKPAEKPRTVPKPATESSASPGMA
jgi:putative FmdB family regulatory protein